MHGLLHPFSRALYESDGHGRVRVVDGQRTGLFQPNGRWIEGEIYYADPHLCGWIGGPRMPHHRI